MLQSLAVGPVLGNHLQLKVAMMIAAQVTRLFLSHPHILGQKKIDVWKFIQDILSFNAICHLLSYCILSCSNKSYDVLSYSIENCQWSPWKLSACTKSCNGGNRSKTRVKTSKESCGGSCKGSSSIVEDCNTETCPGKYVLVHTIFHNSFSYYLCIIHVARPKR